MKSTLNVVVGMLVGMLLQATIHDYSANNRNVQLMDWNHSLLIYKESHGSQTEIKSAIKEAVDELASQNLICTKVIFQNKTEFIKGNLNDLQFNIGCLFESAEKVPTGWSSKELAYNKILSVSGVSGDEVFDAYNEAFKWIQGKNHIFSEKAFQIYTLSGILPTKLTTVFPLD